MHSRARRVTNHGVHHGLFLRTFGRPLPFPPSIGWPAGDRLDANSRTPGTRARHRRNYGTALSPRALSHPWSLRRGTRPSSTVANRHRRRRSRRRSHARLERLLILRSVARDEDERIIAARGSGLPVSRLSWLSSNGGYWHRAAASLTTPPSRPRSLSPRRCRC